MKKLKKIFLLLFLVSFSMGTVQVFAEDETTETVVEEEIPVEEGDDGGFINDERVTSEDQANRDKEVIKSPIETPASVTGEKYNGSGTVVDFTTTGSKAFYTVQATDHSVYYIIIDLDKTENNVYFLSEMNGEELALNDVTSNQVAPSVVQEEPQEVEQVIETVTEPASQQQTKKSTNWSLWILGVGAIILFAYQFTLGKLKDLNPLSKNKTDEDELLNEEDVYIGEFDDEDDDDEI
ncbi:CD1107 family mobile element protein [Enterococcus olivae]